MKVYASGEFMNHDYINIEEVKEAVNKITSGLEFDKYAEDNGCFYTTDDNGDKYLCLSEEDSIFEELTGGE